MIIKCLKKIIQVQYSAFMPFKITYHKHNYIKVVEEYSKILGVPSVDNQVNFPSDIADGYCKAYSFENGLSAIVHNYIVNRDLQFNRLQKKEGGVAIYLIELSMDGNVTYKVNDAVIKAATKNFHALRVMGTQSKYKIQFPAGCEVKAVIIYLEKEWISNNLGENIIRFFNEIKEINYFKEFIHSKQQKMIAEVFNLQKGHPYPGIFVKSRILTLLNNLLEGFLQRERVLFRENLSEKDFEMLQKIENTLLENLENGFPSIEKLARLALMSESKLKKLFKQAFSMGMYEFFQKHRMIRAKDLIQDGRLSITEVGQRLGYQNLGNFSAAFKKEFNCLPSQVKLIQKH